MNSDSPVFVNVMNDNRRQYNPQHRKAKLIYEDNQFFIVETHNTKYLYNKKYWRYEELFVPPVPVGIYVTLQVPNLSDGSFQGEPCRVERYVNTTSMWSDTLKWHMVFSRHGRDETTYPVNMLDITVITPEALKAYNS